MFRYDKILTKNSTSFRNSSDVCYLLLTTLLGIYNPRGSRTRVLLHIALWFYAPFQENKINALQNFKMLQNVSNVSKYKIYLYHPQRFMDDPSRSGAALISSKSSFLTFISRLLKVFLKANFLFIFVLIIGYPPIGGLG